MTEAIEDEPAALVVGGPGARPSVVDLAWRLAFRIGFPLAVAWWRLRRPEHQGALVAVHVGSRLLLVRPSYRREWNLPGGGVRPGEAPEAAARRELREEVGLDAPVLEAMGTACGPWDGRRDRVHLFALRLERPPTLRLDGREVVDARLITAEELGTMPLTGPVRAYLDRRSG